MPVDSHDTTAYNAIVLRYDEIAVKGRNRIVFERKLRNNTRRILRCVGEVREKVEKGRIFILPEEGKEVFTTLELELAKEQLRKVFGLVSFSPVLLVKPEFKEIENAILKTFPDVYNNATASSQSESIRYAMRVRRNAKYFPMRSKEIEIHFAEKLMPEYPGLVLDLKNPELRVDVEIRRQHAFICYERIPGPGGLPTGSGEKLLALLSGGIDSPVACHQVMKRGCSIDYVTFHSAPYTPEGTITKTARLAEKLNEWQPSNGRLFAVNLLAAQKQIRDKCSDRFRTILYRRMMMRIAAFIASRSSSAALLTGEAIGQVASQTIPNMKVIDNSTDMLILRPLVTFDKLETIYIARRIGTMEISNEPMPDSCTVFAPDSPATSATISRIEAEEESLDIHSLMRECLEKTVTINPENYDEMELSWLVKSFDKALEKGDSFF